MSAACRYLYTGYPIPSSLTTSPAPISARYTTRSSNMSWQAKTGCAEHHRAVVERIVNANPSTWLLHPQSGELFDSLDHCNRRLRGYALAEGFDIIRKGAGPKSNPSWLFRCIHYSEKTRNNRKLEDRIERDKDGSIISKRQRDGITVR